jgi:hypothetical protein
MRYSDEPGGLQPEVFRKQMLKRDSRRTAKLEGENKEKL